MGLEISFQFCSQWNPTSGWRRDAGRKNTTREAISLWFTYRVSYGYKVQYKFWHGRDVTFSYLPQITSDEGASHGARKKKMEYSLQPTVYHGYILSFQAHRDLRSHLAFSLEASRVVWDSSLTLALPVPRSVSPGKPSSHPLPGLDANLGAASGFSDSCRWILPNQRHTHQYQIHFRLGKYLLLGSRHPQRHAFSHLAAHKYFCSRIS